MTHPADLPNARRPVAQTEDAGDDSMLQTVPRKTTENIVPPKDSSKVTPPQSPSQQDDPVSQGKVVFIFEALYSHSEHVALQCSDMK